MVEAVLAQESEWMRVAVLQHLIDDCRTRLVSAPYSLGECCQAGTSLIAGPKRSVHPALQHGFTASQGWRTQHAPQCCQFPALVDMPAKELSLSWPA